uniref:Autophagy related 2B n=1 Tax=Salmo trutta TaxID=8032 RepID=A0A673XHZ8_SALTR
MPWPFSESIKKRACRYLLHRYLGNFLQEKLSLDQLSLDLYQGTGSLAQVPLDKWSLNEILESVDAPFEVIEGFIQTISLTVPWASLLQENCALEVKGLEMVFRPRPRMASGMEPMYWSSFMTSSMQLAKECLSQRLTDDLGESFQPLEGLEKFAETIETVLRRVKVTFLDTVLRIEHVPENSKTGICLQVSNSLILSCVSAHPTKAHGDESRPELVFRLTLGSLAVCVLHIDPLPPPDAAPSPLAPMAADFFRVVCSDQLPPAGFIQLRTAFDDACPYDHLRFVAQGMKVTYEHCQGSSLHSFSTDVSLGQMELLECLFPSEAQRGVSLRGVQYTEVKASPPTTSTHKAFTEVFLDDSRTPANTHVSIRVNAPVLSLVVRFPIPDLRSDQERGPWFKKSLQKEVLYLELEDLEVKTEFTGGSSPEQTKMELTFRELVGMYEDQPAARFLRVSHTMDGDMTTSDSGKFDWPRVVLKVNPTAVHSILERVTAEEDEGAEGHSPEEEEEGGGAHSLKDVCDFGKPEPSPFSSRRVMYENEEMVIPGDVAEMTEFQEKTMSNSRFILELCLPNVQLSLPNKAFYEKLHNRINNDLLLWEPNAPSPVETVENMPYGVGLSVASQLINAAHYTKDSFSPFRSTGPEEFWLEVKNGVLFSVTQYEGYKDRHYICFHTSNICLYHQGLVEGDTPVSDIKLPCRTRPHWLEPAIYPSETDRASPSEGIGLEDHSMLSVAVKISSQNMERNVKEFLVAVGVRGTTLQHRVVPPKLGWYDQIVDFLNVSDEPVLGYIPPASVTTLHLHLWSCSLDYRPLYLPLRSLLVVETFSISSSVSLDHSSSTLRYRSFWMKQRCSSLTRVRQTLVKCVVDMGTLELRITAVKPGTEPRFELRCSSDVIHIRTCSDSCAALMNLIQYVASYGDLVPPPGPEAKSTCLSDFTLSLLSPTGIHEEQNHDLDQPRSDLFLFPDESGNLPQELSPTYPTLHSPLITPAPSLVPETDDFCILETPGSRADDRDEEPLVNKLIPDSIEIKDDHFGLPLDSSDSSRGALNFPVPELRYLIREISVIWHLYGGKDFGSSTFTSSPARSWGSPSQTPVRQSRGGGRAGGGRGRNPDVLMEIQLSKVRFQHEVYPQAPVASGSAADQPVSRQVLIVQDLEIRDRLATSQMNKFLYLYSSKEMPRTAHSNMLTVRALHMCPETGQAPQECCLRVSLMPLRLNIDQDALFFLKDFFASLAAEVEMFSPPDQEGKISLARGNYEIFVFICLISLREFRFTSEVPIRLDYHGKHVSMEQGTFAGIVIGLTQLNCSELKLRRLCYRQGLLGVDKLFSYAINEWLNDIKKNQLPGLLGGVGPIHSLVQLVQGFRDLVWLPIEQYRKDGRVVRGLQRGTASFGTSTAMAALELTNRMVRTIQAAAETAYDMVSPGSDEREMKRIKRFSHYRFAHQPVDLREGVANAYSVVKEGITDTALTIYDTATREHEQRGMTGAVGGVLRQLPPAVVKPLIMATEATSNVLGGMRNQIHPDARQEESQKWRQGEE